MQDTMEIRDTIEKSVWIDASVDAVWRALVDSGEFGAWFRATVEGPFEAGRLVWMESTSKGHEGERWWVRPVELAPPRRFAFDWPAGEEVTTDEPDFSATNRVTFELAEEDRGTRLTVVESGFAALPEEIAARKYPDNVGGWEIQTANIKAHVEA